MSAVRTIYSGQRIIGVVSAGPGLFRAYLITRDGEAVFLGSFSVESNAAEMVSLEWELMKNRARDAKAF